MTIKQLADQEGISKAGARHILAQLGLLDQLERDEAGVLQVTDDQAEAVHAHRQRKVEAESNRESESADRKAAADTYRTATGKQAESQQQEVESTYRKAESADADQSTADQAARLLALLEQDLQTMREQLAAKDAEVLALRQQLDDARLRIDQLTNAALKMAGKPLLEQDNRSRFRRAWDALRGKE